MDTCSNRRKADGTLWQPRLYDFVCRQHFQFEDFYHGDGDATYKAGKRHKLKPGVVPSIFDMVSSDKQELDKPKPQRILEATKNSPVQSETNDEDEPLNSSYDADHPEDENDKNLSQERKSKCENIFPVEGGLHEAEEGNGDASQSSSENNEQRLPGDTTLFGSEPIERFEEGSGTEDYRHEFGKSDNAKSWSKITLLFCQLCRTEFYNRELMLIHIKHCSEKEINILFEVKQCLLCKTSIRGTKKLLFHIKECSMEYLKQMQHVSNENPLQNHITDMTNSNFTQHLNSFTSVSMLKLEGNQNNVITKPEFDIRERSFQNIDEEMVSFDGTTNLSSNLADNDVTTRDVSNDKMMNVRELDEETYKYDEINSCPKCGKICRWPWEVKKHLVIHEKDADRVFLQLYKCNDCGKSYQWSDSLAHHKRLLHAAGERLHGCDGCEKKFTTARALQDHRMVHSGEKPYPCQVCKMRFTQPANLRMHHKQEHSRFKEVNANKISIHCNKADQVTTIIHVQNPDDD